MPRDFTLNPTAAKEANAGGKRISEPGVYVGRFRAAWYERNEKGTESVHFIFVNDAGQEAGPLALYTHKGDGSELPSYRTLNAILACMKLRGIKAQRGTVALWDADQQREVEKPKDVYPALVGPRIGLVLTAEEYESRNGQIKQRLQIGTPFNADTRQTAAEVLNSDPATALDGYVSWLEKANRWVKPLAKREREPVTLAHSADDFADDDIPFD